MRLLWCAATVALLTLSADAFAKAPQVVVSIKPIHSLVAGVMAGIGEPGLLVKGGASPHEYSLTPGDAQALANADIVVSVGPSFETFLTKPLEALSVKAARVEVSQAPNLTLLPARAGGLWEEHSHSEAKDAHDHDHDNGATTSSDGHIWLDPHNARAIVNQVVKSLVAVDPENAPRYEANAGALVKRLDELDQELAALLTPHQNRPFIVFHDAYQYFDARYKLRAVGSITISPERAPGARRLKEIKDKITSQGAVCIFAEPQFEPKVVTMLVKETGVNTGVLDPEGTALPPGPDLYFTLIRSIGKGLEVCLAIKS
jgi:zinc transport system substrate-binding protein